MRKFWLNSIATRPGRTSVLDTHSAYFARKSSFHPSSASVINQSSIRDPTQHARRRGAERIGPFVTAFEDACLDVSADAREHREIGSLLCFGIPVVRGTAADQNWGERDFLLPDDVGRHVGGKDDQRIGAVIRRRAIRHRSALRKPAEDERRPCLVLLSDPVEHTSGV